MSVDKFINADFYLNNGGGGGGGSNTDSGDNTINLVRGCTNSKAINYNSLATIDDGSCKFKPIPVDTSTNVIIENTVYIHLTSIPTNTGIIIDDKVTQFHCPWTLTFNAKELLETKIFKAGQSDNTDNVQYKVTSKTKINSAGFKIYIIELAKLVNNEWKPLEVDLSNSSVTNLNLKFDITNNVIRPPDNATSTKTEYKVEIVGDVSENNIIKYITSDGSTAFVEDDIPTTITVNNYNNADIAWIQFEKSGISNFTHSVNYKIYNPNDANPTQLSNDFRKELLPGLTRIIVIANKIAATDSINTPDVEVENDNLEYNISSANPLNVVYNSHNSQLVLYTLGTTTRTLDPNGIIRLKSADFRNGIGQYTLYLQPVSTAFGSGPLKRVHINVVNKTYLDGPDITKINYPYNIKGADFKGFKEHFKISWQSINTNYIEIYVTKHDKEFFITKGSETGAITLSIENILKISKKTVNKNTDKISFDLILIPFNAEGDKLTSGKEEKITILFDKGNLRLKRAQVIQDIKSAFESELNTNIFKNETSQYLTHYAHLGDGNNKLIAAWAIDTETFSTYTENKETSKIRKTNEVKSLVLKLYEPLSNKIQPNQQLWISKIQSLSIIDQLSLINEEITDCISLTPNFNLEMGDDIGYQILDDLVASGSVTSTELLNEYVGNNEFSLAKLNINYISGSEYRWDNFVKYSSATERAENFFYKVKLIEFHETALNSLTDTSLASGSISILNQIARVEEQISNVKKGFDAFEKLLYTKSGSLSYPGAEQNTLSGSTDLDTQTWYNNIISSADLYDTNNKNLLVNNIPQHILNDPNGQDFVLFFHMIGQHFDVLSSYIKGVATSKTLTHSNTEGITNDLIYHMLESLGWDADMGVRSQYLWEYAFGKNKDGTNASAMTGKERQQEIWRRLLNNLPYLYKHKGTKRALHAAMACYGIPTSMLSILEFGGPVDPTQSGVTKFTFDDRTSALNFDQTASVIVPWKKYESSSIITPDDYKYPNSVEMRINTEYRYDQTLVSSDAWSLKLLAGTGSLASVELSLSGSGGNIVSGSTTYFPVFNDEYTQIVVNRTLSGSDYVFDIYGKEGFNERIRNEGTGSLIVPTGSQSWGWDTNISIGTTLSGSIDEFRLWSIALDESRITNHTLLPDAIDGNHVSSSTEDLIFRLDFEYPKDRNADPNIKNVAINTFYGEPVATAVGFPSITSYPYQYVSYERTVTANVPATGIGYSNKVRFESQTLENYLNFGSTSNVTSFDNADDSNKLGLFFSPTREINMNILRSLGQFNIDNYIGNPADIYKNNYSELDSLRKYYFTRFNLNIYEYIQLVRYIDQTLFTTLESLIPARAKVASGLLIEPHLLERNKYKHTKPIAKELYKESSIDVDNYSELEASTVGKTGILNTQEDIELIANNDQYNGTLNTETDLSLAGTTPFYNGIIPVSDDLVLISDNYSNHEVSIDAKIEGTLTGAFFGISLETIGINPNSVTVAGFGIWATNGNTIRTYIDKDGNRVQDRKKVYRIQESNIKLIPENIDPNDPTVGTHLVPTTFYDYKVTFLNFDQPAPIITGNITEVVALDGYLPSHYRYTNDLTSGLANAFFNGSKQTSATTLDGGPAVETFITNPNILKVSNTGRGSGEPILDVS